MDRNLLILALVALFVGGGLVTYANMLSNSMEKVTEDIKAKAQERGVK